MLKDHTEIIVKELADGTGAGISLSPVLEFVQTGLDIWFSDLPKNAGPIVELRHHGLKSYHITLRLGMYSKATIELISKAPTEDIMLARSLISSITAAKVSIVNQCFSDWKVLDGTFKMSTQLKYAKASNSADAAVRTSREVIVPMMAAMAELIGYDVNEVEGLEGEIEGSLSTVEVSRRERNPRNRLLCLRIHGYRCKCCGLVPTGSYGEAGRILEVHHIQPISALKEPRRYDPAQDLIPLCPNCHRAVHTKRPLPYSVSQLQDIMDNDA